MEASCPLLLREFLNCYSGTARWQAGTLSGGQVDGEREPTSIAADVVASSVGRSRWPARMWNRVERTASRYSSPAWGSGSCPLSRQHGGGRAATRVEVGKGRQQPRLAALVAEKWGPTARGVERIPPPVVHKWFRLLDSSCLRWIHRKSEEETAEESHPSPYRLGSVGFHASQSPRREEFHRILFRGQEAGYFSIKTEWTKIR